MHLLTVSIFLFKIISILQEICGYSMTVDMIESQKSVKNVHTIISKITPHGREKIFLHNIGRFHSQYYFVMKM